MCVSGDACFSLTRKLKCGKRLSEPLVLDEPLELFANQDECDKYVDADRKRKRMRVKVGN